MKAFLKLLLFILFCSLFIPSTYALVIGAVFAISILKFTVFLVSTLAIPVSALIHVLKKGKIKEKILLIIGILGGIFLLSYLILFVTVKTSSQGTKRFKIQDSPSSGDLFIQEPKKMKDIREEIPPQQIERPDVINIQRIEKGTILFNFSKIAAIMWVVLMPLITLITCVINKLKKDLNWTIKKVILVDGLLSLILSILGTFALAGLTLLSSGYLVV